MSLTLHCLNEIPDLTQHGWETRSDNVAIGFFSHEPRGLVSDSHLLRITFFKHDRCTVHHPLKSRCHSAVSSLKTCLLWTLQNSSEWTTMQIQHSLLTRAELL